MPRRFIRRLLPSPKWIREHRSLKPVSELLHDPNLWHLNRHSVSVAAFVGVFFAFIPMPLQMLAAAGAAVLFRCNLTLSVALVWITNPLTMPAIWYGTYRIGAWLMGIRPEPSHMELSVAWFEHRLATIWEPLLLGSFVTGLICGCLAYVAMRVLWRVGVQIKWRRRQRDRISPRRRDQS